MKFIITMKDPDGVYDSIEDSLTTPDLSNLTEEEADAVIEKRREERTEIISKWFEYSEYISIEIDTDAKTARIIEV